MSKRVLILVEGQTEERFTKDVLAPAFWEKQLFFQPTILVTKRVKNGPNFKGGVTNFAKFENDARRLLSSAGGALVTTMLDYCGLPSDFPGMKTRPAGGTPLQRVLHVEAAIAQHFDGIPNFLPFLTLHEFEAWLFSSPTELPRIMNEPQKRVLIETARAAVTTPEEINERPQFAPSKQIETMFPAYKKTLHGPTVAARIGLEQIRAECPHFDDWLTKLENFADE
ncbi:MAG TPA: DUF4276 family protein [Candidatus Acidoferrum sp.]|nr:DUF4276 family protein [Candidatus Acidoferrum sp.]